MQVNLNRNLRIHRVRPEHLLRNTRRLVCPTNLHNTKRHRGRMSKYVKLFRLMRHTLDSRSNRPANVTKLNLHIHTNNLTLKRHTRNQLLLRRNSVTNEHVRRMNTYICNFDLINVRENANGRHIVTLLTYYNRHVRHPAIITLPYMHKKYFKITSINVPYNHLLNIPLLDNSTNLFMNHNVIRYNVNNSIRINKLRSTNGKQLRYKLAPVREVHSRLRQTILNRYLPGKSHNVNVLFKWKCNLHVDNFNHITNINIVKLINLIHTIKLKQY